MDDKNNQPKPLAAPEPALQQPAQPVMQQPMQQPVQASQQSGMNYQMPPKKGLSKGALWGIIGGSIGLVVLVVTIVLVLIFTAGPTKEDYANAARMMSDFSAKDITDSMNGITDVKEMKKRVDEGMAKADKYMKDLGDTKAMRDKDVKAAYDVYKKDYETAKPILLSMVDGMIVYKDYSDGCGGGSFISFVNRTGEQVGKEFDDKNSKCFATLEKMKNLKNSDMANFAKAQHEYLKEMRTYYVSMADYFSKKDLSSPMPKAPNYPKHSNPMKGVQDELKDIDITKREKTLHDLLKEKSEK